MLVKLGLSIDCFLLCAMLCAIGDMIRKSSVVVCSSIIFMPVYMLNGF